MRLGTSSPLSHDSVQEWAAKQKELGCRSLVFPLNCEADDALIDEYAKEARANDLLIAEVGIWRNAMSLDPDERQRNRDYTVAQLKLADRQKKTENKIESLTRYLEAALAGEKFKSNDGTVDIRYRKSKKLVTAEGRSEAEIAADLVTNGFLDMVKVKAPELNKTALKNAILKGEAFDGLEVVETQSMQIN